MNKKILIPAVLVIVLVVAAGFLAARKGAVHPTESESANSNTAAKVGQDASQSNVAPQTAPAPVAEPPAQAAPPSTTQSQGHFSTEQDVEGVDVQVFEVAYDGDAYTPNTLSVKNGDIVIFKNNSKGDFWPASNPHPLHTDYPEFDPKKPIAAGKTFEFKFTKVGTWKFHDHLNPTARGAVTVK